MNCMRAGRGLNRRLAAPLPGSSRATGSGLSPRDAGRRAALARLCRRVSGPARQQSLWGATADACGFVLMKAATRRRAAWMYGTCFMRRTRSCRTGALPLPAPSTAKWAGARDSVHVLAAAGLNRQVLAAGLNLHLLDLTVTVPCAAARLGEVMGRILRPAGRAPSVIDYGFDASLGAREALRGQVYQEAAGGGRTGMARAVARLRDLAGLAGDPGAAARVLPRGLEGAVLAEVIGAAILHDGAAPEGEARLAVERVVRDMSDARAWRRCSEGCRPPCRARRTIWPRLLPAGTGRPSSDPGPGYWRAGPDSAGDGRGPGGGAF